MLKNVVLPVCLCAAAIQLCLSLIAPLLPARLQKTEGVPIDVTSIFAVYNVAKLLSGFLWAHLINKNKIKNSLLLHMGAITIGLCTVAQGLGQKDIDTTLFTAITIVLRILTAFGSSAYSISIYAIMQREFPTRVGLAFSLIESLTALPYCLFIPFAKVFYEEGGLMIPFMVYGGIELAVYMCIFIFIPTIPNTPDEQRGYREFLSFPSILTALFLILVTKLSMSFTTMFLEKTVLEVTKKDYMKVGITFAAWQISYLVSVLIIGMRLGKTKILSLFIFLGLCCKSVAFLMWSAKHLFQKEQSETQLYGMVVLSGFADGMILSGCFIMLKTFAMAHEFNENMQTYNLVSSSYNITTYIGLLIGSVIAGILTHMYKDERQQMGVESISKSSVVIMIIFFVLVFISPPFIIDAASYRPKNPTEKQKKRWSIFLLQERMPTENLYDSDQLRRILSITENFKTPERTTIYK